MAAIEKIVVVVTWCKNRGIEVNFHQRSNGLYEPVDKRITINSRLSPERQLFVLLHECGHHMIGFRTPGQRFGNGYATDEPSIKRSNLHRIDVVDEELEAWHRGLRLAKRLKIDVNIERFNQTRVEYVKTYLRWATKDPEFNCSFDEASNNET